MSSVDGIEMFVYTLVRLHGCNQQQQCARSACNGGSSHLSLHMLSFTDGRNDCGEFAGVKSVLVRNVSAHRAGMVVRNVWREDQPQRRQVLISSEG